MPASAFPSYFIDCIAHKENSDNVWSRETYIHYQTFDVFLLTSGITLWPCTLIFWPLVLLCEKQLSAEVQYIIPTNHVCRIVTHVRYIKLLTGRQFPWSFICVDHMNSLFPCDRLVGMIFWCSASNGLCYVSRLTWSTFTFERPDDPDYPFSCHKGLHLTDMPILVVVYAHASCHEIC